MKPVSDSRRAISSKVVSGHRIHGRYAFGVRDGGEEHKVVGALQRVGHERKGDGSISGLDQVAGRNDLAGCASAAVRFRIHLVLDGRVEGRQVLAALGDPVIDVPGQALGAYSLL